MLRIFGIYSVGPFEDLNTQSHRPRDQLATAWQPPFARKKIMIL